ncbi:MAG: Uma2 family endonuclease [Akkermansiaceae bacterium]|nr:Uma2 family endonuclease [Akkermansiaceae bacterium]
MSSLKQSSTIISPIEYLEGEPLSEVRHEYIDGLVFAMAGSTLNHNRITLNIAGCLDELLNGSSCRPFASDVKVKVKTLASETYYYPDVVVTCHPEDTNDQFLENPTTIFEVLSESTERIDRNEKFLAYKNLESLEDYILVSQERREVTIARRKSNWQAEVFSGEDFSLQLACSDTPLTAERIYRNVDLGN